MRSEIEQLQEALDADPGNWEVRRQLAEHLFAGGDSEAAAALISEAPGLPDGVAEETIAALGQSDGATTGDAGVIQIQPEDVEEEPAFAAPPPDVEDHTGDEPVPAIPKPLVDPSSAPPPDVDGPPEPHLDIAPDTGDPSVGAVPAPAIAALQATPVEDPLEGVPGVMTAGELHELEVFEEQLAQSTARKDKLSSVFISVIVHAVIILILGLVIIAVPRHAPPEIVAVAERATVEDPDIQIKKIRPTVSSNTKPASQVVPVLASTSFSSIAIPTVDQPPPDILMPGLSMEAGLGMAISFTGTGDGWVASLPAAIQSRCSLVERMSRLKVGGGSKRCETAVERSLTWLSENQNSDGSWGRKFPVAMTGLSLLSFLGRCETPDSPLFAETVVNAATYLMDVALKNEGQMVSPGGKLAYEHGIAAYALCELYTLSRRGKRQIPELRGIIESAIPIIINGQNPNGSWLYKYAKGRSDTSVTGWQIQALKAAMNTEINIPNLESSFEKSIGYLLAIQQKKGGFGYSEDRPEDRPSLSGVGVLGLQFGGREDSSEVKRGLEYILDSHRSMSYSNINFYGWYYSTQACFQDGGKVWRQWNDRFLQPILEAQESDGHWPPERSDQTNRQSDGDGDVYRTCLATLMLEVYYRYLPTGEKIKK